LALHSYFLGTIDEELENYLHNWDPIEHSAQAGGEGDEAPGVSTRPNQYFLSFIYLNEDEVSRFDLPDNRSDAPQFTIEDIESNGGDAFTALAADGSTRWRVLAMPGSEVGIESDKYDPDVERDVADYYVLS